MEWKSRTTLAELATQAPDRAFVLRRENKVVMQVTVHELLHEGRMPGSLSLDQVESALQGSLQ